jgi:hypothetical protein
MFCMQRKYDDGMASTTMPEAPTTDQPEVSVDIETPDHTVNELFGFVDEPEVTEEPDGYGYGV